MLKNLSFPEWLALFRIITFPIIVALLFFVDKTIYAWLYVIFFSTDVWDGLFAKILKNDSPRREILDTWGDNCYMFAGLIGLYHYEPDFFNSNLYFILIVIGFYVVELILSLYKFGKPSNFHNLLAKAAAFSQFAFLAYMLFFEPNLFLFYIAVIFSILDVIDEILILSNIKHWQTHIKGFWEVI